MEESGVQMFPSQFSAREKVNDLFFLSQLKTYITGIILTKGGQILVLVGKISQPADTAAQLWQQDVNPIPEK